MPGQKRSQRVHLHCQEWTRMNVNKMLPWFLGYIRKEKKWIVGGEISDWFSFFNHVRVNADSNLQGFAKQN